MLVVPLIPRIFWFLSETEYNENMLPFHWTITLMTKAFQCLDRRLLSHSICTTILAANWIWGFGLSNQRRQLSCRSQYHKRLTLCFTCNKLHVSNLFMDHCCYYWNLLWIIIIIAQKTIHELEAGCWNNHMSINKRTLCSVHPAFELTKININIHITIHCCKLTALSW